MTHLTSFKKYKKSQIFVCTLKMEIINTLNSSKVKSYSKNGIQNWKLINKIEKNI